MTATLETIRHKYAVVAEMALQPNVVFKPTRQQSEVLVLLGYIDDLEREVEKTRGSCNRLFDELIQNYKRAA